MKIQEIIEENIKLKEKEILELYSKLDKAKEYYLLMLVDEKNIDSQYAKSIRNTIIKNYPKIKIMNYIITKENFKNLEDDFYDCIQDAKNFEKIKFEYYGTSWVFEWFNENIKAKKYNKN